MTYKTQKSTETSRHYVYEVISCFRFVPPDNVLIFWNDWTDLEGKVKLARSHVAGSSEWRFDVRQAVSSAWYKVAAQHGHNVEEGRIGKFEPARVAIDAHKREVAERFKITPVELWEILDVKD